MADQVSVAQDFAKAATTGFELAQQLHKIAHRVGAAGAEVRIYAKKANAFSKLLFLLRSKILLSSRCSNLNLNLRKKSRISVLSLPPLTRVQQTLRRVIRVYGSEQKKIEQAAQKVQR
jgi:hypothetical protein